MPSYTPSKWNSDPAIRKRNNCYNYAADKMQAVPSGSPRAFPVPAVPGRSQGLSGYTLQTFPGQPGYRFDFTHKGLRTAAQLDGFSSVVDTSITPDCWRVAFYIRPATAKRNGDHHWVREDSPGKWSHKPGAGKVTNQKYNPKTKKYNAGPITDPSKENVGAGYKFCGYLYMCPKKVTLASLLPEDMFPQGEAVLFADTRESFGLLASYPTNFRPEDVSAHVMALSSALGRPWTEGVGEGELQYRLDILSYPSLPGRFSLGLDKLGRQEAFSQDLLKPRPFPDPFDFRRFPRFNRKHSTVLISTTSLSVIDGEAHFISDPDGLAFEHFTDLFGLGQISKDSQIPLATDPDDLMELTFDPRRNVQGAS